ncbi:MAG: SH3 domain-containing protein [Steroidobacteraceae bacterium]|jgi:hypothetical protein|nr:SH3 domain-containing protein [Steroidobacteraceae bacterium]
MRITPKLGTLLILALASGWAHAADDRRGDDEGRYVVVSVADPYLELHTGPGRGYPVFHVVPRGQQVDVLMRRTDWFKVRDERGREGWAHRRSMLRTLLADGTPLDLGDPERRDYSRDPWEAGAQSGDFGGGNVNTAYVGYSLNEFLSAEVSASQVLGRASNAWLGTVGLVHTFRPDWRVAPFVGLGTGVVRIEPKATIVAPVDRTEQIGYVGAGAKYYLSRRFVFRGDYRRYVIFTERERNEVRDEWKVGFAFFF